MDNDCTELRLSEIISALSFSLDLTEGQPPGHCIRSCWIGTQLAIALGYSCSELTDIYYTILLKDAGCSSNAERLAELYGGDDRQIKKDYKTVNSDSLSQVAEFVIRHAAPGGAMLNKFNQVIDLALNSNRYTTELFTTRCERGAEIATDIGFSEAVADGIRYLDEHWDGKGQPYQLSGEQIPIASQLALLSQVVDVFYKLGGTEHVRKEIRLRRGTWFSAKLVDALDSLLDVPEIWQMLDSDDINDAVVELEPTACCVSIDEDRLDRIAQSFANVVDAKSHFTFGHSSRVAHYTSIIARNLGYADDKIRWLNRGALLHDLGKLGISNTILDKPDQLNDDEWSRVRKHPELGEQILQRVSAFADIAFIAGQHHERLDGKGYPLKRGADQLSLDVRIVTVADVFDAISADRPYRKAVPIAKTLDIMWKNCDTAFDKDCLQALTDAVDEIEPTVETGYAPN